MGVTCVFYGATEQEAARLLAEPSRIHTFLSESLPVEHPGCVGSFLGQKRRVLPPTRPLYDLGKSWGAVHFVLTGTKEEVSIPLGFIMSGGSYVGDEDVGYGPARVLYPEMVRSVASAMQEVDPATFRERINAKKMRTLHLSGAPTTDDPGDAEYLVADYEALRQFVSGQATQGRALVIQFV